MQIQRPNVTGLTLSSNVWRTISKAAEGATKVVPAGMESLIEWCKKNENVRGKLNHVL